MVMSPPSQQLQSILDRLHRRDPPFQRPAFDLERHLTPLHDGSSSSSCLREGAAAEHAMRRIVREEILCRPGSEAATLDEDFLQFVLHMRGPGTLANRVRIFAPLPAGDPSPLANMQFHTSRIRDRYRSAMTTNGSSAQIAHTFPIDRLLVFARHTEEPIWFAFGTMLDDPQLRSHVFALHENLERSPPPVVVSRSGFVGFLRRVCRLPGNGESDGDGDDESGGSGGGDFMEAVLDHFRSSDDDDDEDDDDSDESDVDGMNGAEEEEEGESIFLEFRPFADIVR